LLSKPSAFGEYVALGDAAAAVAGDEGCGAVVGDDATGDAAPPQDATSRATASGTDRCIANTSMRLWARSKVVARPPPATAQKMNLWSAGVRR
jgi:hypothetical protein